MGPIEGNEIADDRAREAAGDLGDSVPKACLHETSFAQMTRMATGARSAGVTVDRIDR